MTRMLIMPRTVNIKDRPSLMTSCILVPNHARYNTTFTETAYVPASLVIAKKS